jgi:hypothetical protein
MFKSILKFVFCHFLPPFNQFDAELRKIVSKNNKFNTEDTEKKEHTESTDEKYVVVLLNLNPKIRTGINADLKVFYYAAS